MRRLGRTPWLVLSCVVLAGCYSYKPLPVPTPGADVRAQLTTEAAVRHSQGLEDPVLHYDGIVVETTPDTLVLNVLVARSTSTFQNVEIRDTVRLGSTEIQSILGRKLSATKSVLVTVLAGAAAFAIIKGIDQVVGGTGDDNGGEPPPGARVPVLRWVGTLLRPVFGQAR